MAKLKMEVQQLENETRQDYIKFCVFVGMGSQRTIIDAYRLFYETEKPVSNSWRTISEQNKWFERASEYDKALHSQK
jgi:hypothetical protein